ncbi:MAG TPA: DUF2608 domain-containing protein [Coxiellaceae bacterium]|nr:MAG: hypothetical protein A3E81_06085 [Gammaproteobacteria bacterium RIFCSPHIGHO2_12_FULL_36_30]HLB56882.1 DUF2608 domain-containing protein [Coxiellaceae bacterium]
MMKKIRVLCLFLSAFLIPTALFANSTILTANSFFEIQQMIAYSKHPHHLLVVLDDDDTLTMEPCYPYSVGSTPSTGCQYIGGPAWFSWQTSSTIQKKNLVWKTFPQLLEINNFLFAASKMPLDDPEIPAALQTAQEMGAHIIVASARGYSMSDATENQFSQDCISQCNSNDEISLLSIVEKNAIKTPTDHIDFPGYYFPTPWGKHAKPRRIAYIHGILYLSGQNKGVMLKQFLVKTNEINLKTPALNKITNIIFVDDTNQNVIDVAQKFSDVPNVNVISVHYTRLAQHKAIFKTDKTLHRIAYKQWKNIEAAVKNNLPGSNF